MREKKFRAWDKKSKKMREVVAIVYWSQVDIEKQDGSLKLVNLIGRNCIENKSIVISREIGEFELMEYIGLRDRNGKEICEGDIIKYGRTMFRIEFWDCSFAMTAIDKISTARLSQDYKSHIEVIGNIYENPELLENE